MIPEKKYTADEVRIMYQEMFDLIFLFLRRVKFRTSDGWNVSLKRSPFEGRPMPVLYLDLVKKPKRPKGRKKEKAKR